MNASVPDCSLLIDGLDRMVNPLLDKHANLQFRMHSIRMQLQLNIIPNMATVEQWARSLLAELEILAVSGSESSGSKRNRVAALTRKGDKGSPAPKAEAKRGEAATRDPCKHWITVEKGKIVVSLTQPIVRESAGFVVEITRKLIAWLQVEARDLFQSRKPRQNLLLRPPRLRKLPKRGEGSKLSPRVHLQPRRMLQQPSRKQRNSCIA